MPSLLPKLLKPWSSLYLLPLLILSIPLLSTPRSHHTYPLHSTHSTTLYIIPTTYGGTGNQLYFLLEAIHIAFLTNSTLLLPPPPPRNLPDHSVPPTSHNIDTIKLSSLIPLRHTLPHDCHNSFTHIIHAHRTTHKPKSLSSRALTVACHFTNSNRTNVKQCGQQALSHAKPHDLYLPLTHLHNNTLQNLLPTISGCVLLDGHSYNRAGEKAQEALHSYLHYLQPSHNIRQIADLHHPDVVVHLRYDEYECFREGVYQPGMVCIRTRLSTHKGVMQFVEPHTFVNAIVEHANNSSLHTIYLAFSPYVPSLMVQTLQNLVRQRLTLVPRIKQHDPDIENLVERQLATNAKLFVGDFGSTWSGTVYYKRRTLQRVTVWGCRLLNRCQDLGYYRFTGPLRDPHWFHSLGLI